MTVYSRFLSQVSFIYTSGVPIWRVTCHPRLGGRPRRGQGVTGMLGHRICILRFKSENSRIQAKTYGSSIIFKKNRDDWKSHPCSICRRLKLLSYDLILEGTLDVLVALYSCLVYTKLLSSLSYCDVLLVNLYTCSNESLSKLSCSY